jgi:hypothetical protein
MLDGLTEDWLEVSIVRPTGGGAVDADPSDDAAEPREVTITPHGARWAGVSFAR